MAPEENENLENPENSVGRLAQKLAVSVSTRMDRNAFFQILSSRLRELFTTTDSASTFTTGTGKS